MDVITATASFILPVPRAVVVGSRSEKATERHLAQTDDPPPRVGTGALGEIPRPQRSAADLARPRAAIIPQEAS
ncbi:unnamed protein product [Lampetra planeri]